MCESCRDGGPPLGLIWWRVSGDDQLELSPSTQINSGLEMAKEDGVLIPEEYILGSDWASLEVWNSPPMEQVKELITKRAIHYVYLHIPDRTTANPVHRLMFRALCEEHEVQVRARHGQIPTGEVGQFIEFADAWAKEKSVRRAQIGAKEGLRDRAKLKGFPPTGTPPYGYRFRYRQINEGVRVPEALIPDPETYYVAGRIWHLALAGYSLRRIAKELLGIPSPRGHEVWSPKGIAYILHNSVYAGRYVALRTEVAAPKQRRHSGYGKTSSRRRRTEEQVPLPNFPIESPIVSMVEFDLVQKLLPRNRSESRRNARLPYLLNQRLVCAQCNRCLSPYPVRDYYYYVCPLRREHLGRAPCTCPRLPGAETDALVWGEVVAFLNNPTRTESEIMAAHQKADPEPEVRKQIAWLKGRLEKAAAAESMGAAMKLRVEAGLAGPEDIFSAEALGRAMAQIRAERTHYQEELKRQEAALAAIADEAEALASLETLRLKAGENLVEADLEQRRWVLRLFNIKVKVHENGRLQVFMETPRRVAGNSQSVLQGPRSTTHSFGFSFSLAA